MVIEEYPDLSRYAVTSIELILKTVDDFYEGVARGSKHRFRLRSFRCENIGDVPPSEGRAWV